MKTNDDILIDNISFEITESIHGLFRIINREFFSLLWRIGNNLNEDKLKTPFDIKLIFNEIHVKFNELFSQDDIKNMMLFAEQFAGKSKSLIFLLSDFLSWSHMEQILYLKSDDQKNFYVNLVITEALTDLELKRRIESNDYEKISIDVKKNINSVFHRSREKNQLSWTFNNVSESSSVYYNLMDSKLLKYLDVLEKSKKCNSQNEL